MTYYNQPNNFNNGYDHPYFSNDQERLYFDINNLNPNNFINNQQQYYALLNNQPPPQIVDQQQYPQVFNNAQHNFNYNQQYVNNFHQQPVFNQNNIVPINHLANSVINRFNPNNIIRKRNHDEMDIESHFKKLRIEDDLVVNNKNDFKTKDFKTDINKVNKLEIDESYYKLVKMIPENLLKDKTKEADYNGLQLIKYEPNPILDFIMRILYPELCPSYDIENNGYIADDMEGDDIIDEYGSIFDQNKQYEQCEQHALFNHIYDASVDSYPSRNVYNENHQDYYMED